MSKCAGCGLYEKLGDHFTKVRVGNGALMLCQQCLDDVNRKNPAAAERDALRADEWILVELFRSPAFDAAGREGDCRHLRPCQMAAEVMKRQAARVAELEKVVGELVEACELSEEAGCNNHQCPGARYTIDGDYSGEYRRCKRHKAAYTALASAAAAMKGSA